jgi:hypothetical protein
MIDPRRVLRPEHESVLAGLEPHRRVARPLEQAENELTLALVVVDHKYSSAQILHTTLGQFPYEQRRPRTLKPAHGPRRP